MPRSSLIEYLQESSRWSRDCAVVWRRGYRTERWSYARLSAAAQCCAASLEARGVGHGDRVLLWGANSGEWTAAFWAVLLRGAVVVPLDHAGTGEFARAVARQVNPRLLLVDASLSGAYSSKEFTGRLVLLDQLEFCSVQPSGNPSSGPSAVQTSRTDIAEIIFTSGSTAEPKGVVLTHGNLLANIEPLEREIARYLNKYRKFESWVHPLRFLEMLPLSHVFGQFMGLFVPQLLGATVVFSDTLNPSELIRTARRERVSVLAAVPRLLESIRNKLVQQESDAGRGEKFQRDLAGAATEHFWKRWWRFRAIHQQLGWKFWVVVSGGAALGGETEQFWRRLGFLVIQGYGLTETASLVSLRHPFQKGDGSIGKPLPGREMRLDASGEILVRGENVAAGYWTRDGVRPLNESAESSGDAGWFRTGDLGELDGEGNLYFKGRKKNVLVTAAGMNVYPEDIESALRAQPEVRDCAVVVVQIAGREQACAALVMRESQDAAAASAVERANQQLAEFQRLRWWRLWPHGDLPRTSTGKPRLSLIRETLQAQFSGRLSGLETVQGKEPTQGESTAVASPLREILRRMGKPSGESESSTLEGDLKLTSIDRVELLSEIEDRFQMDVSETEFTGATTVGELEKLLQNPAATMAAAPAAAASPYPYARWPRHWAVAVLRELGWWTLVLPAMRLLGYPRVEGREWLRRLNTLRGPVLLTPNHQTEIDAAFVLAALPGRLRRRTAIAMVGERLRDMRRPPAGSGWWKQLTDPIAYTLLTALFQVYPLPKKSGVRGSFEFAGELVDRGWSVMIFPEGQLTRDGSVGPFRGGIGVLARALGVPVVPVRVAGLYEMRQAGRKRAARGEIAVRFGEAIRFDAPVDVQSMSAEPEEIARRLRDVVANL